MSSLVALSRLIDGLSERVGRLVSWCILISVLVSAVNAIIRKAFDISSNAWLELQWYLFAAVFMLCSAYTLRVNEHIRIDIVAGALSRKYRLWTEFLGTLLFLLPFSFYMIRLSVPAALDKVMSGEVSVNAGGLILWPVWILMPLGFALLFAQGLSQLIKSWASITAYPGFENADPHHGHHHGEEA